MLPISSGAFSKRRQAGPRNEKFTNQIGDNMKTRNILFTIIMAIAMVLVFAKPVAAQSGAWDTAFAKVSSDDQTEHRYTGTATIIATGTLNTAAFNLVNTDRILESFLDTKMINDTGAVTVKLQYKKDDDWKDLATVFTIAEKLDSVFVAAKDTSIYAANEVTYRYNLTGGAANDTIQVKLDTVIKRKGFR